MRESTRRIKIKPNKGVHPCRILAGLTLCIQITLPHCSHFFPSSSSYSPHHATCQSQLPNLQLQLQLQLSLSLSQIRPSALCLITLFAICCASPSLHDVVLYIVFKNIVSHKFGDTSSSAEQRSIQDQAVYFLENAGICLEIISTVSQVNCLYPT